jgi:catechol 2,3-dioxygenase-like lactoylglutathione lyase family enzyme
VAVPTRDIAAGRLFYEEVLGMKADDTVPSRLYFHCGGVIVALVDWSTGTHGVFSPTCENLYLAVEDLDAVHERAIRAGAPTTSSIETRPWGERSFYCLDLDGNHLCFVDAETLFLGHGADWA